MSIKDGVKYVQEELSGDEKILEGALKIETLYKKYRLTIWGVVIVALLFVVANSVINVLKENRLEKANEAFLILQENPQDKDALQALMENNPNLYALLALQDPKKSDTISSNNHWLVSDVVGYTKAANNQEIGDSKLFGELAQLATAKKAIMDGDLNQASMVLRSIDENSPAIGIAQLLQHFTLKGN